MKKRNLFRFLGISLFLILMSACVGSDAALGQVGFCRELDSYGQPIEMISDFSAGEAVIFVMEFIGGYKGLETTITWKQEEVILQTDTLKLEREANSLDPLWIATQLESGADWPSGEYTCEYFVPDQGTQTITFTLE